MSSPAVMAANPRPSDLRRRSLNMELSIPLVSNFFPIDRYYDAAQKVYESFQACYTENNLDDAYVYGKRYCLFCVDAIPTHNYYAAPRFAKLKNTHIAQTNQVYQQLEQVVAKMDMEEQEKERQRQLQKEREQQEQLDRWQKHIEDQKTKGYKTPTTKTDVQASALSKLQRLSSPNGVATATALSDAQQTALSSQNQKGQQQQQQIRRDPSGEPPMGIPSSRYRVVDDSDDELQHPSSSYYALPPPIPPPALQEEGEVGSSSVGSGSGSGSGLPPPPSYEQIRSSSRNFLGPAAGSVSTQQPQLIILPPPIQEKPKEQQRQLPIRVLQQKYLQAYHQFTRQGKISVSALSTYQGRNEDSTNGCTVISALVAASHMRKPNSRSSVTDEEVVHVIDRMCGPVLRQIRNKLGLGGTHALLIPSDVHDHLVDSNVLSQDHFEGAAGGNVMDVAHMGEFVKLLAVGESGQGAYCKAAATFFFREHVISIVKYFDNSNGSRQASYDLIDSLAYANNGSGRLAATRTRCSDLESLQCLLGWYTSRKFTDSNCSYIDSHKWDDNMADFDPRVFQGFVWMEKPKNKK